MAKKQAMKTSRKLMLLGLIMVMILGGGAGLYYFRMVRNQANIEQQGPAGLAALEARDYQDARAKLAIYVQHHPDDAEALYALSQAQRKIPSDDGQHLVAAIGTLRRVLDAQPDHPKATDELLELYRRVGFGQELVTLTERILEQSPDDWDALDARVEALSRMREYEDALEAARQMVQHHGDQVQPHLHVMTLMQRRDAGEAEILAYAEALDAEQIGESRRAFLIGAAYRIVGQREQGLEQFKLAAEDPPADAVMLETLSRELDRGGEVDMATEAVEAALARDESDPDLRRLHVSRLLQRAEYGKAKDWLVSVNAASADADSRLLVFKAMALAELGETAELSAIRENLAERRDDPVAEAWAPVLDLGESSLRGDEQARQVVEVTRRARDRLPQDPFLALLQGRAYAATGEDQLALDALREAAQQATAASLPLTLMAEIYNRQERHAEAAGAARQALLRNARDLDAAVQMTLALADHDERPDDEVMLQLVNNVQAMRPGEPRTLPLHVQLLFDTGDEQRARLVLQAVAESERAPGEQLLLQLATVARPHAPELAEQLQERSHASHGMTPRLTFMQAVLAREQEGDAAGLQLFEQAEPDEDTAAHQQWQLYRAHYLEAVAHENAASAWRSLFESGVDDQNILQAMIRAESVRDDRTFHHQIINRLEEVTGERSTLWRMARARWWLSDPEGGEKAAGEAALLLNEVTRIAPDNAEAHWLLANCLARLDNERGMIDSLQTVLQLEPDRVDPALSLAAVLQERGDFDEAEEHLRRVSRASLNPVQRRRAAMLWVSRGEADRAIELLESSEGEQPASQSPGDLLLAELYLQREQADRSDEMLKQMLADPEQASQPQTLRFAADFYASQGDTERSQQMLQQLQQAEGVDEETRQLMLARHYATFGPPDSAREAFAAAIDAAPESASAWRVYLLWLIQRGEAEQAAQVARRAAENLPDDAGLQVLVETAQLETAIEAPLLRPLIAALLTEREAYREAAQALLADAIRIHSGESDGERFVPELQQQADQHPRFLALQNFAARILLAMDRPDEAVQIATRTSSAFPNQGEPLELAARALSGAGRHDEAITFARRWREAASDERTAADVLIARSHLRLDRPQQALDQLQPSLQAVTAEPETHAQFIATYGQALVATEQYETAAELLQPLLAESPRMRAIMRGLAQQEVPRADVAEAWLEQVDQATPDDALEERVRNAMAWQQAGARLGESAFQQVCEQMVDELVELPDAPAMVHMLYGELAQLREDWEAAERGYRKLLELQPDNAPAKNNLAMVLLEQDRQLLQAVELAREAAEALPNVPEIHDTLARLLTEVGQYEEAVAASRRAYELQPDALKWRLELIWTLARAGELDEAAAEFEQLQPDLPARDELPESSRERVEQIEQRLTAAADGRSG